MSQDPAPVLYVEDDDNDAFFMRRAWAKVGVLNRLNVLTDGQAAIDYLSGTGPYANRVDYPLPCLVVLDIRLPRVSGLELLHWIRSHSAFVGLRVIVLSSSTEGPEFKGAYALGIDTYVAKPANFDRWCSMVGALKVHWLKDR